MGRVIMLAGPVGAGKTTVAKELACLLPESLAHIEGDKFWSFIAKTTLEHRENFRIIMRAMTAAAIPFVRSGYDVLLDFSLPPEFTNVAPRILKDIPMDYVVLLPSQTTCAARAAAREEGAIADYEPYSSFYSLFQKADKQNTISDDEASAAALANRIHENLIAGRYRINSGNS